MSIQEEFARLREKIENCSTLALLDSEGETVISASKEEIDEFDVKLFGAQMAVALAKEINGEKADFVFFGSSTGSAAAKMLDSGYFICLSFDKKSYKGYAERWLEEIDVIVREEFF